MNPGDLIFLNFVEDIDCLIGSTDSAVYKSHYDFLMQSFNYVIPKKDCVMFLGFVSDKKLITKTLHKTNIVFIQSDYLFGIDPHEKIKNYLNNIKKLTI